MKHAQTYLRAGLLLLCALPAVAQNGCVNSPENPTAILAAVGIGGVFVSHFWTKRRARKKRDRQP